MKRVILAVVAVFLAWSVMDFVIHGVVLASSYAATASLWRPMNEMKTWVLYISVLIAALSFVLEYSLFFTRRGISTGLRYGLLFGVGARACRWAMGVTSVMPIPYHMVLTWFLGSVIEAAVGGVILGAIVRDGLGYDLRRTLSLRWPSWPATLASVLLGLSAWVLVSGLVVRLMPPPDSLVKTMERFLVLGEARQPLWVVWLALAVTPALCEETFFRGLMLGGLRSVGKYTAMAVSALAFGLAHASNYRLLPTFLLGLILAYVVWKSGSIVCAMIVHALNNGLIAMISREPALATRLGLEGAGFSAGLLATSTLLAAMGFWILARMPEPGGTSRPVTR